MFRCFAKVGWTNGPFDNSAGAPPGQEPVSLLLGLPTSGSFDYNTSEASQAGYYALFPQDEIRVNPIGVSGIARTGFSASTPIAVTNDGYLTPYSTLGSLFPAGLIPPIGPSQGLATNLGRSASLFNPDRSNGCSLRWNFHLQRELPGRIVIEAGYFGNRAAPAHRDNSVALNFVPARYLRTLPTRDQKTIDYLIANVAHPFTGLMPGTTVNGSTVQRQ